MGFEFENNSEPFSVFNLVQAIAVFIFEIVETSVSSYPAYLFYTIVIGTIGLISCGIAYSFEFKCEVNDQIEQGKKNADKMH